MNCSKSLCSSLAALALISQLIFLGGSRLRRFAATESPLLLRQARRFRRVVPEANMQS